MDEQAQKCGIDRNPDGTYTASIGDQKFSGTYEQCREWLNGPKAIVKDPTFPPDAEFFEE